MGGTGTVGAGRAQQEQQGGVEARRPFVRRPGPRRLGGEEQEVVPPGQARVEAARGPPGRRRDGLGGQLAGQCVVGGAQPRVPEDVRVVAGAQLLEGGVRRRRVTPQELGQPGVGDVRVDPVTGVLTVGACAVVPSHHAASSQPYDPRGERATGGFDGS
ncbi:hypothetical protein [Streptomyces tendae]